jgi:hypothetical protein
VPRRVGNCNCSDAQHIRAGGGEVIPA